MKINAIKRLTAVMLSAVFINLSFTACTSDNKAGNTTATETNESEAISKQDDFYTAVNKKWISSAQYSEDIGYINYTTTCQDNINSFFSDYITQLHYSDLNEDEKKLLILYEQYTDGQLEASVEIAREYVQSISKAEALKDIETLYADPKLSLYNGLFNFELTSTKAGYALELSAMSITGINMAESPYILDDNGITKYTNHINDLLMKSKIFDKVTAFDIAEKAVALEVDVAQCFAENRSTYNKSMHNPKSDFIFNMDFPNLLTALGYNSDYQYVTCLDAYTDLLNDELLTEDNVENLKAYLTACVVCRIVGMTDNTSQNGIPFYGIANYYMRDVMVSAYLNSNITDEDIDNVTEMVDEIIAVYKAKINNISYLSDDTKGKALRKLDNINAVIAIPGSLMSYANADVSSTYSYVTNCENCLLNKRSEQNKFLSSKYSIEKIVFDTMEVNAHYYPGSNSILIHAGILQEPVYSREKSFEENLGGIGTIVAHEISHSLDIAGSEYDENGDYKSWWSIEDRKAYIDRAMTGTNDLRPDFKKMIQD
ncbi:MAG: M13-type metalloendopeptidase, partial [Acutalibacteraceae bacterium]|nr:M13-type metalloendopeptidase [Acutalibacteraceae bacterium]